MKAFTDYPFVDLGDEENKEAPVREIEVLSFDGDKYCRVKFGDVEEEIKAGYIYQREGRLGFVPTVTLSALSKIRKTT